MTKLVVAVALVLALAVLAVMGYAWGSMRDVEMSAAGYVALATGVVLSFGVGTGLMFLMFYSNRRGFDEPPQMPMANGDDADQPFDRVSGDAEGSRYPPRAPDA
jgi:hypothetical protein